MGQQKAAQVCNTASATEENLEFSVMGDREAQIYVDESTGEYSRKGLLLVPLETKTFGSVQEWPSSVQVRHPRRSQRCHLPFISLALWQLSSGAGSGRWTARTKFVLLSQPWS